MAKDKKSFLMYADWIFSIKHLTDEQAGKLLKHLLSYVNDEEPKTNDPIINITFEPIKQQLKRDLEKWEDKLDKKSISGREGNLKRWYKEVYDLYKSTELTLEDAENMAKGRKRSHTDKVPSQTVAKIAVNDNVNVNVNVTVNETKQKAFISFWNKYPKKVAKDKCKDIFLKLKESDIDIILDTIDKFLLYKPFEDYNHPNPSTYLNQKRWNDELPEPKKVAGKTWSMANHLKSLEQ